jgi:hypothetical protein
MPIIKVSISSKKSEETRNFYSHGGKCSTHTVHCEELDLDNIDITMTNCGYRCICMDENVSNTDTIPDLVKAVNIKNEKKSFNRLKQITKNNIYTQVYKIIKDDDMDKRSKLDDIERLINNYSPDNQNYSPDESSDEASNNSVEKSCDDNDMNELEITRTYPFKTSFKKIGDVYVAEMHLSDNYKVDCIYITLKDLSNGGSCCHSVSTHEGQMPVDLTTVSPIEGNNDFDGYDRVRRYKKHPWENEFKYGY